MRVTLLSPVVDPAISAEAPMHAPPPLPPASAQQVDEAATGLRQSLDALGFVDDPEMATTPERVSRFLAEFRPGPLPEVTPLATPSTSPIVIRAVPYYSLCAHHLLPFFGHCTIAVRPNGAIAGLGWFPRLLQALSRRPQLQERLAEQLVHHIHEALAPQAVAVVLTARQMCVEMRGAEAHGLYEVTATAGAPDGELLTLLHAGARQP